MKKRLLSLVLTFSMMLMMLPGGVFTVDAIEGAACGDFTVAGGTKDIDYTYTDNYDGGILNILSATPLTISGTTTNDRIVVDSVATANLTFSNLSIHLGSYWCLSISNAKVNLTLVGDNVLKSSAAVGTMADSSLTITADSTGSLLADSTSGSYPGIGNNYGSCGTITINGGTVTALGGISSTGIGGHDATMSGTITINGGTVTAMGGVNGAGIGGEDSYSNVSITGGNVKAVGGQDAYGIGRDGFPAQPGTLTGIDGVALDQSNVTTLSLDGVTDSVPVTDIFITNGGSDYVYSTDGMNTLDVNKLYLYLPDGAVVTGVVAGGKLYEGSGASGSSGSLPCLGDAAARVTSGGTSTNYTNFASALSAAQASSGSTLKLLGNVASASTINLISNMTLDLNGHTLDMGGNSLRVHYYASNYGELTITDSSEKKSGVITSNTDTLRSSGRVTINGGTIQTTAAGCFALWCESNANVVINGGNFIGTRVDVAFTAGALTINGGNFTATGLQADAAGVTIKGGTFSHIQAPNGATANSLLADGYQYYVGSTASGTAANGTWRSIDQTVTVGECDWSMAVTYDSTSKTCTVLSPAGLRWISGVSNGTVTADTYKNDPALPDDRWFNGYTVKLGADIDLSGRNWTPIHQFQGTFDGAGHTISNMKEEVSGSKDMLYGGFFDYLYVPVKNLSVSGSVTVTGGSSSAVYAGGIAGAAFSGMYNCEANVNVNVTVASGNNGYAAGLSGVAGNAEIFNCVSLGSVMVSGGGTAVAGVLVGAVFNETLTNCYAAASANPALSAVGQNDSSMLTSIGTYDVSGNLIATDGTTLTYGSTLANAVKYWVNQQGANAVNYVTWTTDAIPTLTTTYAAAYIPQYDDWQKQEDGSYTRTDPDSGMVKTAEAVVISSSGTETPCETLEDAVVAAESMSGSTVKLMTNVTTESAVKINTGTFTIDLNGKTWTSTVTEDYGLWLWDNSNVTLKDSVGTGIITSTAGSIYSTVFVQYASATIESGTYDCTGMGSALIAFGINDLDKKVTINGGTFKNSDSGVSPFSISYSNLSISGGTFDNDSGMGIYVNNCYNVSLTGGTYADIQIMGSEDGTIHNVGGLLSSGYAYKTGSAWVSDVSGNLLSSVTVKAIPVSITAQPAAAAVTYGYTTAPTLNVAAVPADSGMTVNYQWYSAGTGSGGADEMITGAASASYSPAGLEVGEHNYYCVITCDGYILNSDTVTVMVNKIAGSIANSNYVTSYTCTAGVITEPVGTNFTTNSGGTVSFTWYKGDSTADTDKLTGVPSEVGNYTLKADVVETDHYTTASTTVKMTISYLETDATAVLGGPQGTNGWFTGDVGVYAPDGYQISSSAIYWAGGLSIEDPSYDGTYTYYLKQISTGYITAAKTVTVKIDGTAPTIGTLTYSEHQSFLDWLFHKSVITVTVPVTDDFSGGDHILYVLTPDGGTAQAAQIASVTDGKATFTVSSAFKGTVDITAYDKAGNASATVTTSKMAVEDTAPTITVTDGTNTFTDNWYTTAQTLHIGVADAGSGLKSVTYTVDNGSAQTLFEESGTESALTASKDGLTITAQEGIHTYVITATDNALNTTTETVTVKQDTSHPVIGTLTYSKHESFLDWLFHNSGIEVTAPVTDAVSGADYIRYVLTPDGGTAQTAQTATVTDGNAAFTVSSTFKGTVTITAYDKAGNVSTSVTTEKMYVEDTVPTLTVNDGSNDFTNDWHTTAQTLHISASDAGSGIKSVTYTVDGGDAQTLFAESDNDSGLTNTKNGLTIAAEDGTHTYVITATDNALNVTTQTVTVSQDTTVPTISASGNPGNPVQSAKLSITATVGASGIKNVTVSGPQGDKDITGTYQSGYSVTQNGTYTFTVTNNSDVSVTGTPVSVTQIDTAQPVVVIDSNGYTDGAWTKNDVTLNITNSTANLGSTKLEYSTDSGKTWTAFDGSLTDSAEGVTTYLFRVTSESGVVSENKTFTVKIDKTAPANMAIGFNQNPFKTVAHFVTFGLFFGDSVDVNFSASDTNGSGIDYYEYQTVAEGGTFDANGTWQTGSLSIAPGFKGTVYARAVDQAGNISGYAAKSLVVEKTAPVIMANSGDSALVTLGTDASIPVTVTDNGAGVSTVTYQINGGEMHTVDLTSDSYSDLTQEYSFSIGNLPDGAYDVVVNAADNSGNAAATATVHVTKNAAQTGFQFASASVDKTYGDDPFTVAATGGQSGETVTYAVTSGADVLGVDAVTGKVTIQKAGTAVVTATKAAGVGYVAATAELTVTVLKVTPTIQTTPTASDITVIGKLSSSQLTGGKASVSGTFGWTNPDAVITKSGSYDVTFTPTDTDNYSTVTCKVPVTVSNILTDTGSDALQLDCTDVIMPSGVTFVSMTGDVQSSGSSTATVVEKLIGQDESLGSLSGLTVYNLKLLDQNGNPIEPTSGKIKVKIPVPAGMSGNLKVFWYNPADGTITDMNATQENGYMVFETSHFSFYAIAQLNTSPVSNPKTGTGNWPIIPLALLGGGAAACATIIEQRRFLRKKKQA